MGNKVPQITLNNGISIPQLGLGVFQTPEGETTANAVDAALQCGYRHIDTAHIYGNEVSVGEGIRRSGVPRHEIFLTTKLWNDDIRAGRTREAFYESLEKLGTDYVDLYLIHWPVQGWQQAWEEMSELYAERRVRAIGVSNFQQHHMDELAGLNGLKEPVVDQVESSPQFANQGLVDNALSRGINVEAWSPLGGTGGSLLANAELEEIARQVGKSPAQVVIRWHIQRCVIVIPKSTHAERIRQNFDVFDFELTEEQMNRISALDTGKRVGADPDNFDF